jgi:RHS repeat-associated protein
VALAYDEAGRPVRRTLTRPDGTTSETRSIEGLYEQSAAGARSSVYVGTLLVALRTTPAGGTTATRAVLTDHLGSILTTVELGAGTIRQQVYSPFGLSTMAATDDSRYTGVAPDTDLGLVQMGARWYCPQLGRFITPDWFIIESPTHGQRLPQSLNVYSYAINNPIMLRDPSGKFFGLDDLIVAAVGFVVGFVTGVIVGIADGRSFGDTLLLGLEAGLCGAAGAWLAYITVGAATAALGALGLGMGGGVTTGLGIGAAVFGGLNGVISGSLEIYDWGSPIGWLSFLADSTWGLVGTTFAVLLHGVNLFYGDSQYNSSQSRRQNRHIYDGGFGFSTFAFTQGNVTSNLNHKGQSLLDHETSHIWTSRIFGPIFQVTYVVWLVVGGIIGGLIGIGMAIAGKQGVWDSAMDVGYFDNPWETWAYDIGGKPKSGALSWT